MSTVAEADRKRRRGSERALPVGAALAVLARPWLWGIGVVQVFRLARRGWWRRAPFLPVPDHDYLRFRLETQYGDPDHRIESADLLAYLRWCRTTSLPGR